MGPKVHTAEVWAFAAEYWTVTARGRWVVGNGCRVALLGLPGSVGDASRCSTAQDGAGGTRPARRDVMVTGAEQQAQRPNRRLSERSSERGRCAAIQTRVQHVRSLLMTPLRAVVTMLHMGTCSCLVTLTLARAVGV